MNKTILGIMLIFAVSDASFGQDNRASWQNVERLKTGKTIRIIPMNAPHVDGKFLRASSDEIFIEVNKRQVSVQRVDVQRIDLKKGYKRFLHALIGTGIGVAAGLAVFASARSEDSFYGVALPLFPVLVGGGTVAGALLPGYSTLYKAP